MIDYPKLKEQLAKNPDPIGRAKMLTQKLLSEVEIIAKDADAPTKQALEELTKGLDAELGSLEDPPKPEPKTHPAKHEPEDAPKHKK